MSETQSAAAQQVLTTPGLVALWTFEQKQDRPWFARSSDNNAQQYPMYLRQIGDEQSYTPATWPYDDDQARLRFDHSGPFGSAVYCNRGYIYGCVERAAFDNSALDLHGTQPFTMLAWVKFTGQRHLVAGIWDEGGWDRYGGRRQAALFAGLMGQDGVIGHISATGAASYPQSQANGAQFARCRAIDGATLPNDEWAAMAMVFDPQQQQVRCYLNGGMTPLDLSDPVENDVYQFATQESANPYRFTYPIYAPQSFVVKFNGYSAADGDGVHEHRLLLNFPEKKIGYACDPVSGTMPPPAQISIDLLRQGSSLLPEPLCIDSSKSDSVAVPAELQIQTGDEIRATLQVQHNNNWQQVGETISITLQDGAPFTIGRALGLGSEERDHGSQIYIDGVAVFDRLLSQSELQELSLVD